MSETLTEKPVPVVDVRSLADAYRMRAELKDAEDIANVHRKELDARKADIAETAYLMFQDELALLEKSVVLADQEAGRIEKEIATIISQYADGGILEEGDYCLKDVARKPADVVNAEQFLQDFPDAAKPMISLSVTAVKGFLKASKTNAEKYLLPKMWTPVYQVEKKVR